MGFNGVLRDFAVQIHMLDGCERGFANTLIYNNLGVDSISRFAYTMDKLR